MILLTSSEGIVCRSSDLKLMPDSGLEDGGLEWYWVPRSGVADGDVVSSLNDVMLVRVWRVLTEVESER